MNNTSQKAIFCSLNIRAWTARAVDDDIATATENAYEAEAGTLRVVKELTPKEYIRPISQISWLGRKEHYRMTVHGLSQGQHLLSMALFDRYVMVQMTIKEEFYNAVNRFCDIYPAILATAPDRLKKAYKASDFPTEDQIKDYFEYKHRFTPIPALNDWRLEGMQSHDMAKIKGEIEDDLRGMFNRATQEVFERAREVLASIAHQAETYSQQFGGVAGLRDATIENLKEVSDLVMRMNITGDPQLEELGREMVENFANMEAARLRKDEELRKDLAATAKRLLTKCDAGA